MKQFFTILFIGLISVFNPIYVHATTPCMGQTAEEFEVTVGDSALIVHGSIQSGGILQTGTNVKILEVLKGETSNKNLFIKNWKHDDAPLYVYKKNDELIFLLTEQEGSYVLTDPSWKKCIPSLHNVREDLVYDSMTQERVSVEDFAARYIK